MFEARITLFRSLLLLASAASVLQCASTVGPADGSVIDVVADRAPSGPCPASLPTDGTPCTQDILECGYGDSPLFECRSLAICLYSQWRVSQTNCPAASMCNPVAGEACTSVGAHCVRASDGANCGCTVNARYPTCDGTAAWSCAPLPTNAQCPRIAPQIGSPCSPDALECDYGRCISGYTLGCHQGRWQRVSGFIGCPQCG